MKRDLDDALECNGMVDAERPRRNPKGSAPVTPQPEQCE